MVVQIDPLTNAVVDQLDLRGIALAGHRNGVWVATVTGLMVRIDIRGGKGVIAKRLRPARGKEIGALAADGSDLWALAREGPLSEMLRLDIRSGKVEAHAPLDVLALDIASSGGRTAIVSEGDEIALIARSTARIAEQTHVRRLGSIVCVVGDELWASRNRD